MVYLSRLKVVLIGLALMSMIFGAPNVLASVPGAHILLRLDTDEVKSRRLEAMRDQIRTLLRDAEPKINYSDLVVSGSTAQVRISDPAQVGAAKAALKAVVDPIAGKEGPVQEFAQDDSEGGLLKFTMTDAGAKYRTSAALTQSIEVIKNRLNELGVIDPTVQLTDDGILVQAPGVADLHSLAQTLVRQGRLSFKLVDTSMPVDDAVNGRTPAGSTVLYTPDDPPVPYLVENRVIVSGENVLDANATFAGQPVVAFRLDSKGYAAFQVGDHAEYRQAICGDFGRSGDFSAYHPGTHRAWHRADIGKFHDPKRQGACPVIPHRRAAGEIDNRRGSTIGPVGMITIAENQPMAERCRLYA